MAQQKSNKGSSSKPSQYFNFAVGWQNEETGVLKLSVNHQKNARANKDQGYKLFLVPVDGAGDPVGEGIEVTNFNVKQVELCLAKSINLHAFNVKTV